MQDTALLDPLERAARHAITCDRPAPDFFQGALLGNGGLGVVVTTRPDAVVLHFGHNNVWDIRLAEDHKDRIGTFQELFERIRAIPAEYTSLEQDPWYRDYYAMTQENYRKPYPRPMPCGSLLLGFDRRRVEVLGHRTDIATGLCTVRLAVDGEPHTLEIVVEPDHDRVWLRLVDAAGCAVRSSFERARLIPDPSTPEEFPRPVVAVDPRAHTLAFRQVLPAREHPSPDAAPDPRDRAFGLAVRIAARVDPAEDEARIEARLAPEEALVACVRLEEGPAAEVPLAAPVLPIPDAAAFEAVAGAARTSWRAFWSRSGVALDDELLERVWYRNLYFLNSAARPCVTCPGLFANWSYRTIGAEWHGDYHLNYNTQQPFWATFSSNHVDKHLPYVDLVERLLPLSRTWAEAYYGLRGAYFPHSAYPVEMSIMPYPVPTWGWEICETPWTVQSLWWHYLYTMDRDFLRERAFTPIKQAVRFLADYMLRPEASGERWGDDRYHIFPTVPPELYGLMPGFRRNYDCLVDLALSRFVFGAYLQACAVLGASAEEAELIRDVRRILAHLPEYPTAESRRGTVFVSVPGEDPETIYNTPNSIMTVFPGEQHGLHSPPDDYRVAANSYHNHRNEGGNDLVFLNLAGARLGLLDLERFKRQIEYCLLPNGTCTDMVLQAGGRYDDTLPFDFMARMGIWFENFALPAVIDECLLQSYTRTLRFFPNWPRDARAEFRTLRAAGAFLVSAVWEDGAVAWVEITSEAGGALRFYIPWETGARCARASGEEVLTGEIGVIETVVGEIIRLAPA